MAVMFGVGALFILTIGFVAYAGWLMTQNDRLRNENAALQRANETLQRENGRLRNENAALQRANETLQREKGQD